jgi:acyl-CoA reductase-like NAD-dependent aldehyde dehydrogenase
VAENFESRLLIGGEQVAGDGDLREVKNPTTEKTIATGPLPSAEQVDAAIAAGA